MDGETFRKMLIDISGRISEDNFKSMKFFCSEFITKRRLEQVDDVESLWVALEEADKINKDDTEYIETLLMHACQNRGDLISIYRQYKNKHTVRKHPSPKNDPEETILHKLQPEFDMIVANIGRDWRPLVRKLGLTEGDIDYVTDLHGTNLREQCREALKVWVRTQVQTKGSVLSVNRKTLVTALEQSEKRRLASEVLNLP